MDDIFQFNHNEQDLLRHMHSEGMEINLKKIQVNDTSGKVQRGPW